MTFEQWDQPIDWQELDRLVDGQLSDEEYRELIAEIELYPNGWRQCALAFLEHQALQREMGRIEADVTPAKLSAENAGDHSSHAAAAATLGPAQTTASWLAWLSMAICVVVGLTLGFVMQSEFRESIRGRASMDGSNTEPLIQNYNNRSQPATTNNSAVQTNRVNLRMSSPDFTEKIRMETTVHERRRIRIRPLD